MQSELRRPAIMAGDDDVLIYHYARMLLPVLDRVIGFSFVLSVSPALGNALKK